MMQSGLYKLEVLSIQLDENLIHIDYMHNLTYDVIY
jgi:hypothetical protein